MFNYAAGAAVFCDELCGLFRTYAGDAWDVVRRVARQDLDFDSLLGRVALVRLDGGCVSQLILLRVVELHVRPYELIHVLIPADDYHVQVFGRKAFGDSGDDVVGFVAFRLKDRHAYRPDNLNDALHLYGQVIRHRLARDFVVLVDFPPLKLLSRAVDCHGEVIRPAAVNQLQQHGAEHVRRPCRLACWAGKVAKWGIVRTVHLRVPVDDVQGL